MKRFKLNYQVQGSYIVVQAPNPPLYTKEGVKKTSQEVAQEREDLNGTPLTVIQMPNSPIILNKMREEGFTYNIGDRVYLTPFASGNSIIIDIKCGEREVPVLVLTYDSVLGVLPYNDLEYTELETEDIDNNISESNGK